MHSTLRPQGISKARHQLPQIMVIAALFSAGCGGSEEENDDPTAPVESPSPTVSPEPSETPEPSPSSTPEPSPSPTPDVIPESCTAVVSPGDDDQTVVQTALIEATEGSTLCLTSGTYTFATELSLAVDQVTILGVGDPVLDFSEQISGANGLSITSNEVTVEGFSLINPAGDGIRATGVENITFRDIRVIWEGEPSGENGAYGIYPVSSQYILVEGCEVRGASDTGIYVGQSFNVLIRDNEVYENVAGIEIENTTDAEVTDNYCHNNTGGILVFNLPDLPVQDGQRANVHGNLIDNNNHENFAPDGNIIALVPAGTGMMILASDENEVHDNDIRNNDSIGVVVLAYTEYLGLENPDDPNFNPFPESNYVHDNRFENNCTDPQDLALEVKILVGLGPADDLSTLLWDGCLDPNLDHSGGAYRNCFNNNTDTGSAASYMNIHLCEGNNETYDIEAVTCTYDALPSQDF